MVVRRCDSCPACFFPAIAKAIGWLPLLSPSFYFNPDIMLVGKKAYTYLSLLLSHLQGHIHIIYLQVFDGDVFKEGWQERALEVEEVFLGDNLQAQHGLYQDKGRSNRPGYNYTQKEELQTKVEPNINFLIEKRRKAVKIELSVLTALMPSTIHVVTCQGFKKKLLAFILVAFLNKFLDMGIHPHELIIM